MERVERHPKKFPEPYRAYAYILDALCEDEIQRDIPAEAQQWRWTPACLAKVLRHPRPTDLLILDETKTSADSYD